MALYLPRNVAALAKITARENPRYAVTSVLAPLGRPLDVLIGGKGKLYVLEYSRQTNNAPDAPTLPGRILELAVKKQ